MLLVFVLLLSCGVLGDTSVPIFYGGNYDLSALLRVEGFKSLLVVGNSKSAALFVSTSTNISVSNFVLVPEVGGMFSSLVGMESGSKCIYLLDGHSTVHSFDPMTTFNLSKTVEHVHSFGLFGDYFVWVDSTTWKWRVAKLSNCQLGEGKVIQTFPVSRSELGSSIMVLPESGIPLLCGNKTLISFHKDIRTLYSTDTATTIVEHSLPSCVKTPLTFGVSPIGQRVFVGGHCIAYTDDFGVTWTTVVSEYDGGLSEFAFAMKTNAEYLVIYGKYQGKTNGTSFSKITRTFDSSNPVPSISSEGFRVVDPNVNRLFLMTDIGVAYVNITGKGSSYGYQGDDVRDHNEGLLGVEIYDVSGTADHDHYYLIFSTSHGTRIFSQSLKKNQDAQEIGVNPKSSILFDGDGKQVVQSTCVSSWNEIDGLTSHDVHTSKVVLCGKKRHLWVLDIGKMGDEMIQGKAVHHVDLNGWMPSVPHHDGHGSVGDIEIVSVDRFRDKCHGKEDINVVGFSKYMSGNDHVSSVWNSGEVFGIIRTMDNSTNSSGEMISMDGHAPNCNVSDVIWANHWSDHVNIKATFACSNGGGFWSVLIPYDERTCHIPLKKEKSSSSSSHRRSGGGGHSTPAASTPAVVPIVGIEKILVDKRVSTTMENAFVYRSSGRDDFHVVNGDQLSLIHIKQLKEDFDGNLYGIGFRKFPVANEKKEESQNHRRSGGGTTTTNTNVNYENVGYVFMRSKRSVGWIGFRLPEKMLPLSIEVMKNNQSQNIPILCVYDTSVFDNDPSGKSDERTQYAKSVRLYMLTHSGWKSFSTFDIQSTLLSDPLIFKPNGHSRSAYSTIKMKFLRYYNSQETISEKKVKELLIFIFGTSKFYSVSNLPLLLSKDVFQAKVNELTSWDFESPEKVLYNLSSTYICAGLVFLYVIAMIISVIMELIIEFVGRKYLRFEYFTTVMHAIESNMQYSSEAALSGVTTSSDFEELNMPDMTRVISSTEQKKKKKEKDPPRSSFVMATMGTLVPLSMQRQARAISRQAKQALKVEQELEKKYLVPFLNRVLDENDWINVCCLCCKDEAVPHISRPRRVTILFATIFGIFGINALIFGTNRILGGEKTYSPWELFCIAFACDLIVSIFPVVLIKFCFGMVKPWNEKVYEELVEKRRVEREKKLRTIRKKVKDCHTEGGHMDSSGESSIGQESSDAMGSGSGSDTWASSASSSGSESKESEEEEEEESESEEGESESESESESEETSSSSSDDDDDDVLGLDIDAILTGGKKKKSSESSESEESESEESESEEKESSSPEKKKKEKAVEEDEIQIKIPTLLSPTSSKLARSNWSFVRKEGYEKHTLLRHAKNIRLAVGKFDVMLDIVHENFVSELQKEESVGLGFFALMFIFYMVLLYLVSLILYRHVEMFDRVGSVGVFCYGVFAYCLFWEFRLWQKVKVFDFEKLEMFRKATRRKGHFWSHSKMILLVLGVGFCNTIPMYILVFGVKHLSEMYVVQSALLCLIGLVCFNVAFVYSDVGLKFVQDMYDYIFKKKEDYHDELCIDPHSTTAEEEEEERKKRNEQFIPMMWNRIKEHILIFEWLPLWTVIFMFAATFLFIIAMIFFMVWYGLRFDEHIVGYWLICCAIALALNLSFNQLVQFVLGVIVFGAIDTMLYDTIEEKIMSHEHRMKNIHKKEKNFFSRYRFRTRQENLKSY